MGGGEEHGRRVAGETLLLASILAIMVTALWLPEGFVDGIYEEWLFLEQYLEGMGALDVGGQFLRPLVLVPFYAGLDLTPGSFLGLNLILVLVSWGKGVALYTVLRQMDVRPGIASAAAFLYALYPADDGQMTMRTVGIQTSALLLLVSTYLLLRFGRGARWYVGFGMAACLAATILGYEAPLPLALVCPALLLWVDAERRRKLLAAGLWYATLVPLVVRYLLLFGSRQGSYQESLLVIDGAGDFIVETASYLGSVYQYVLIECWSVAFGQDLPAAPLAKLLLAGAAAALAGFLIARFEARDDGGEAAPRSERYRLLAMMAIGLLVVAVGFAMYLPSNARETTWRTLFLPSIGGTLVAVALVRLLAGLTAWRRRLFPLAVGVLVFAAFLHLLEQHRFYAQIAKRQQRLLDDLSAAVPRLAPQTELLLVFDETDQLISHEYFPFSRYLRAALRPRYELPDLNVQICYPYAARRGEACSFNEQGVTVAHQEVGWLRDRLSWHVPYEAVVAVVHDHDGHTRLLDSLPLWYTLREGELAYRPAALVDSGDGFDRRYDGLRIEFDEGLFVGAGWDIERRNNAGVTYRFMSHEEGALHLPLRGGGDHLIEFRIANGINAELLASLGVSVGGERIGLERLDGGTFRGRVPARLIDAGGETLVTFHQDPEILRRVHEERGPLLGLGFDWVSLTPLPGGAAESGGEEAEPAEADAR